MNGRNERSLKPIYIGFYPPLAMGLGTAFLLYLFTSIFYDTVFGKTTDVALAIVFGIASLVTLDICLNSWLRILAMRKLGLYMNESGLTYKEPGRLQIKKHHFLWESITEITHDTKGKIHFKSKEKSLPIPTSQLLENPEWIIERARTWQEAVATKKKLVDETTLKVSETQQEFQGAVCQSCGGNIDIHLKRSEQITCQYCGNKQGLSQKIQKALKQLSEIIASLPDAHRQLQDKALRGMIQNREKQKRSILLAGWITGGIWLLFVLVEVISQAARKKLNETNIQYVGFMVGFIFLSIGAAYILIKLVKITSKTFSFPMQALAPQSPGGPARCRLCGANLPDKGVIRRCKYCQTDSVLVGENLATVEQLARDALQQAKDSIQKSTESAARLLDNTYGKLQLLIATQLLWLHIPIIVAIDGSSGMLIKVTGTCIAMLIGVLISTQLGIHWLKKENRIKTAS
jgi:hypothetical protein